jgi:Uncharacterised protein conserved in bacteria (DUF2336)
LCETVRAAAEDAAKRANFKKRDPIDYSRAKLTVAELNKAGKLNDSSVNRFAIRGEHNNAVAALSLLASVPIETVEQLMEGSDGCGIVVACRASRLDWQTAKALINNRRGGQKPSQAQIEKTRTFFDTLSVSIAQRAIRYGSVTDVAAKAGGPMMPSQQPGARR